MAQEIQSGTPEFIRRLMREEHGVRKCARILFFLDRRALVDLLFELPDDVICRIAREMARLRGAIPDLHRARQEVENEVREQVEVIDLEDPRAVGANLFAFLDGADPEELAGIADQLDDHGLAALVCNAPVESATMLLGSVDRSRWRRDLIEEMTRLRTRGGDRAQRLAEETRGALTAVDPGLVRIRGEGRAARPLKPTDESAGDRIEEVVKGIGRDRLPQLLATVPSDHLALALSSGDAELADLFRRNMSLRRWSDMESERARIGEVEPKTAEAARRAVLFRLQGLLAEEDEDVGNVRDE